MAKKFNFRLKTLLRIRESTRDERRLQLAQAYEAEEIILREKREVETTLEQLRAASRAAVEPGEINVDHIMESQRFELVLRAQRDYAQKQHQLVQEEIERRRQVLVEANREVRVLELLREKLVARHRDEEARADIRRLDEVAQQRACREEIQGIPDEASREGSVWETEFLEDYHEPRENDSVEEAP